VQLMNAGSPSSGGASRNTIIHSRMAVSDTSLKRQPTRLDAVWIGIPTESQRRQESVVHVSDLSCRIETLMFCADVTLEPIRPMRRIFTIEP
jgi:hypothetical protein